jgi:hypothetical protein
VKEASQKRSIIVIAVILLVVGIGVGLGLSAGAGDKESSSDTVNGPNAVPTSAPTRLELVDVVVEQQRIRNGILTNVKRQIGSFVEMDDPRESILAAVQGIAAV